MEPRHQSIIKDRVNRQKEQSQRLSPPKMLHKYQNVHITGGVTPSGFKAPKALNLGRFEHINIFD